MHNRRLAAIMFTDLAGYTKIMGEDEERAFQLLEQSRKIQQPLVASHGGQWIKELGDGAIIIFDSVLDAVHCGMEIQKSVRDHADINLKVAIHSGEVVLKDQDIFGDGVNLTARIETLCSGNTILLSQKAEAEIQNIRSIRTVSLGQFELKNITHPIEVFAVVSSGLSVPVVQENLPSDKADDFEIVTSQDDRFLADVRRVIEANLGNSSLSVSSLCEELAISRPQLYRKIHRLTGRSPSDLIREERLIQASKLLKENAGNVSEIAYQTGFNNLSYFSKSFSERFGVNPSHYRVESRFQSQIPASVNKFVGRIDEIRKVISLLENSRLLTLTGTGGTGKTRLALEVANKLKRGSNTPIFYVTLAPLSSAEGVVPKIAEILRIEQDPNKEGLESVIDFISNQTMLLILDNFEHVLPASEDVSTILASCAELKILVTSRVVLNIPGEHEFAVGQLKYPSLDVEHSIDEMMQYPAIELLINRAQGMLPNFALTATNKDSVASICAHLDGLPLALELAAARIKLFSPIALLKRLTNKLDILSSSSTTQPDRHKTLRAAIEWSYNLLSPEEQTLFRSLSVFSGGFTIEAAEKVCFEGYKGNLEILDLIATLADHSLIHRAVEEDGEPRFYMLETLRAFGQDRLGASLEKDDTMQKYVSYYTEVVEYAAKHLTGPEQGYWLDLLDRESDNLRAVLSWLLEQIKPERGLAMAVWMWRFWTVRSMIREGSEWLRKMLEIQDPESPTKMQCQALNAYGIMISLSTSMHHSIEIFKRSLKMARLLNYEEGMAEVFNHLGWVYQQDCHFEECRQMSMKALNINQTLGNQRGIAVSKNNLGWHFAWKGDLEKGLQLLEESRKIRVAIGDTRSQAFVLTNQALFYTVFGKYAESDQCSSRSLQLLEGLSDRQLTSWAKTVKGHNFFNSNQIDLAEKYTMEALPVWERINSLTGMIRCKLTYIQIRLNRRELEGLEEQITNLIEVSERVTKTYLCGVREALVQLKILEEDFGDAFEHQMANLTHIADVGMHYFTAQSLETMSYICLKLKNEEVGLQLLASSGHARHQYETPVHPVDQKTHNALMARYQSLLGQEQYKRLWDQGTKLNIEHCIELLQGN